MLFEINDKDRTWSSNSCVTGAIRLQWGGNHVPVITVVNFKERNHLNESMKLEMYTV